MLKKNVFIVILSLCVITGCTADNFNRPDPASFQRIVESGRPTPESVQLIALQNEYVDSAKAVVIGKNISAGLKVTNFNRLRLKQIRQQVHQQLSLKYPNYDIHVSTDQKILMELDKLRKDIELNKLSKKEAEKRITKINEDMRG